MRKFALANKTLQTCVQEIEDTHQRSVCCKHLSWNLFIGTFLALIILAFSAAFKIRHSEKIIKMKETKLKESRQKCLQNNCFPMLSLLQFAFLLFLVGNNKVVGAEQQQEEATVLFCLLLFPAESSITQSKNSNLPQFCHAFFLFLKH